MKVLLSFDLPNDQKQFDTASRGMNLYMSLWDLDQHLRAQIKHGSHNSELKQEIYEDLREKLYEIMKDNGVNFNMVQ